MLLLPRSFCTKRSTGGDGLRLCWWRRAWRCSPGKTTSELRSKSHPLSQKARKKQGIPQNFPPWLVTLLLSARGTAVSSFSYLDQDASRAPIPVAIHLSCSLSSPFYHRRNFSCRWEPAPRTARVE